MYNIDEIYKEYYPIVYKYLICLTHNPDISEELSQETFYKMIKKINQFKGESKISVWLCEIAKNLWYDELRKKKVDTVFYDETERASDENIEEEYIRKEHITKLYEKVESLDEVMKRIIYLRLNSDMSFKEIGDIIGKSETYTRVIFYRGKQKLKEGSDENEQ